MCRVSPSSHIEHIELESMEPSVPSQCGDKGVDSVQTDPTGQEARSPHQSPSQPACVTLEAGHPALPSHACNELESATQLNDPPVLTRDVYGPPHRNIYDSDSEHTIELGDYCALCEKEPETEGQFKRCTGCKFVRYCSRTCQAAHWTIHKPVCQIIQAGPRSIQY